MPSLETRVTYVLKKNAFTIESLHSLKLHTTSERRLSGYDQSLVYNQLTDRNVLVHKVQKTLIERVLPLHPQPSSYESYSRNASDYAVEELSNELIRLQ